MLTVNQFIEPLQLTMVAMRSPKAFNRPVYDVLNKQMRVMSLWRVQISRGNQIQRFRYYSDSEAPPTLLEMINHLSSDARLLQWDRGHPGLDFDDLKKDLGFETNGRTLSTWHEMVNNSKGLEALIGPAKLQQLIYEVEAL